MLFRSYYDKNKNKINVQQREYRENNKEKAKEYREKNKDKIKEYRENNKDKMKEYRENKSKELGFENCAQRQRYDRWCRNNNIKASIKDEEYLSKIQYWIENIDNK